MDHLLENRSFLEDKTEDLEDKTSQRRTNFGGKTTHFRYPIGYLEDITQRAEGDATEISEGKSWDKCILFKNWLFATRET